MLDPKEPANELHIRHRALGHLQPVLTAKVDVSLAAHKPTFGLGRLILCEVMPLLQDPLSAPVHSRENRINVLR